MTSEDQCTTVWKQGVWDCVGTRPQPGPLCDSADDPFKMVTSGLTRVDSQRKHNAKCSTLSSWMLSYDKILSDSDLLSFEAQTLLARRNAIFVLGLESDGLAGQRLREDLYASAQPQSSSRSYRALSTTCCRPFQDNCVDMVTLCGCCLLLLMLPLLPG